MGAVAGFEFPTATNALDAVPMIPRAAVATEERGRPGSRIDCTAGVSDLRPAQHTKERERGELVLRPHAGMYSAVPRSGAGAGIRSREGAS